MAKETRKGHDIVIHLDRNKIKTNDEIPAILSLTLLQLDSLIANNRVIYDNWKLVKNGVNEIEFIKPIKEYTLIKLVFQGERQKSLMMDY